jgi:ubiquinone/menaquinone biosynthesis C-methylase UbiE
MDYDATDIPANYDRGRDHGPEVLNLWMQVVGSHIGDLRIRTILDLGCGTGRFSEALADRFNAQVIAVDPSEKMLAQARSKRRDDRVSYELGRGESIPVSDNSVDLIFMSMIFHHLDDAATAARECRRVLRKDSIAFLRAGVHDRIESYPYIEFFPESRRILHECLPTKRLVYETFEGAGFRTVSLDVVTQVIAADYAAYADKLATGADSVLASLTEDEFAAGLQALRVHAARATERPVVEPIDVFVFR